LALILFRHEYLAEVIRTTHIIKSSAHLVPCHGSDRIWRIARPQ
jgi:hypothetical protein